MGRLVLVEGLDLAGKSTLIAGLARVYSERGWKVTVSHGDLCPDNPVAKVTRQMMRWDPGFTPEEGGPLFLASHLWDLRHFKYPRGRREIHIQDSCALRSLAFERVVGHSEMAEKFASVARRLPRFDAAFVLTASLATRYQRYAQRVGNDLHDAFMLRDPVRFSRVDSEILHLCVSEVGARLIDTDEIDAPTLLGHVVADLDARWSECRLLQKFCA